jgi:beclin 1
MYCQKCRTPLKIDKSLKELNPAAFDLLVGMLTGPLDLTLLFLTHSGSTEKALPGQAAPSRVAYPPERKELYDRASAITSSPIHKRSIPSPRHGTNGQHSPTARSRHEPKNNPEMSFIDISKSQLGPALPTTQVQSSVAGPQANRHSDNVKPEDRPGETSLSYEVERTQRLFSILSSHSDIDHPICTECTNLLLSSMNARLVSSTRERDTYISFLKSLQSSSSSIPSAEDVAAAESELTEALETEKAAFEELKMLEEEKRGLEAEIAELEEQSRALEVEEEAFWASRNSFDETLHELSADLSSLQQKHLHDQQQLQRLQRTNVYNDTFCIGHDGYFGTINGLRLGRLPNQHVDWPEINAAWGQTLLLLATVAERLNYTFQGYRLRPIGSTSRIEKIEWPQQSPDTSQSNQRSPRAQHKNQVPTTATPKITPLDLFSSGDMSIARVFWHRRFDAGMVAFLDCLSQVGRFVERTSAAAAEERPSPSRTTVARASAPKPRVLPYPINGEMIGDLATGQAVSIRLGTGLQQDDKWTKACKYTLTCCKFLLAHVSNMGNAKER